MKKCKLIVVFFVMCYSSIIAQQFTEQTGISIIEIAYARLPGVIMMMMGISIYYYQGGIVHILIYQKYIATTEIALLQKRIILD